MEADASLAAGASTKESIAGIGRNAAILTGATLACKAGSLVVMPFVLRAFTKADYGQYSAALAYAGALGMITYFGMGPIVIRDIARGERSRGCVVFHCVVLRAALLVVAALALAAVGYVQHFSARMWALTWLAFAAMGFDAVTGALKSSMQAEERFGLMAAVDAVRKSMQWVLALVVVAAGLGIGSLTGAVVAAAGAAMAAATVLGVKRSDFEGLRFAPRYAIDMLRLSAPMGLSAAFVLAIERVDIWVLDVMRGPEEVGVYAAGAAFRPAFLAQAVVWAMLPLAFRLGRDNHAALAQAVRNCGRFLLIAGTGMALFFVAGGPVLMPLLGGGQYAASVPVFELMGLTLPFTFASFLYLHALTAVDRQMVAAGIFAGGLAVNAALDIALVPSLGATGAMLATLTAEAMMAAAALAATWRLVGMPVAGRDIRIVAAALGAALAAAAVRATGITDAGVAAPVAFAVLLLCFKAVTSQDIALLRRSFVRGGEPR